MYQELFTIPFTPWTVKGYGTMMVIGFLVASFVMQRLSKRAGLDALTITNAALYCLIAGVIGARIFFVLHHYSEFRGEFLKIFEIWNGGLEFLGGVILAVAFLVYYLRRARMPIKRVLDILAMGLMLALVFGRMGCILNGCCWGKPTTLPWGIRFPYGSFAYTSQINPNPARGRDEPRLKIPLQEYCIHSTIDDVWYPKPIEELTETQQEAVTQGPYRCLPVHPSQAYASLSALLIFTILYGLWERGRTRPDSLFARPGMGFALMFVLYGLARFLLELTRDDNPFEWAFLTVSQIIGLALIAGGTLLMVVFALQKADTVSRVQSPKSGVQRPGSRDQSSEVKVQCPKLKAQSEAD
jgi:phosphatidylglycerol:prolipoprotein diacylglycerol transferase